MFILLIAAWTNKVFFNSPVSVVVLRVTLWVEVPIYRVALMAAAVGENKSLNQGECPVDSKYSRDAQHVVLAGLGEKDFELTATEESLVVIVKKPHIPRLPQGDGKVLYLKGTGDGCAQMFSLQDGKPVLQPVVPANHIAVLAALKASRSLFS